MSIQRMNKYVALALNNSSEGEARNAASRFFKTLKSLDMRFNSKQWGLNKEQALRLAELGGVELKIKPTKTAEPAATEKPAKTKGSAAVNVRATCYRYFDVVDMNDKVARRNAIDALVRNMGFDKRSVQSYASNYRAGKWRA